jgi:hypothetical protein
MNAHPHALRGDGEELLELGKVLGHVLLGRAGGLLVVAREGAELDLALGTASTTDFGDASGGAAEGGARLQVGGVSSGKGGEMGEIKASR